MLMEWAELKFVVRVSDADESYPDGLTPNEVARFIAGNKNKAVLLVTTYLLRYLNNFRTLPRI